MVLGCLLILLGLPFAACNWYSPFSEGISGKHTSMVFPPIGGLLIGAGIYSISGSWLWSLLAIPADMGLLFLLLASPWLAYKAYSVSRFTLVYEFSGHEIGRKAILRLYRNSHVRITLVLGDTTYGLGGNWALADDGYRITYSKDRECKLIHQGDAFLAEEAKAIDSHHSKLTLSGLTFRVKNKGLRT